MKLKCKLFGHKWGFFSLMPNELMCKRCGVETTRRELERFQKEQTIFGKTFPISLEEL